DGDRREGQRGRGGRSRQGPLLRRGEGGARVAGGRGAVRYEGPQARRVGGQVILGQGAFARRFADFRSNPWHPSPPYVRASGSSSLASPSSAWPLPCCSPTSRGGRRTSRGPTCASWTSRRPPGSALPTTPAPPPTSSSPRPWALASPSSTSTTTASLTC